MISSTSIKLTPFKPVNMHFALFNLALVASAALSAAAPSKGPPGPPKGSLGSVSQSCSASQSSIHCCQANGNKVGSKKNVYYPDGSAQLVCSQITGKSHQSNYQNLGMVFISRRTLIISFDVCCRRRQEQVSAGYLLHYRCLLYWRWLRCNRQLGCKPPLWRLGKW